MTLGLVELAFMSVFWGIAVWMPSSRNLRFLVFMAITTAAFVVAGTLHGEILRLVRAGLVMVWAVALLIPDRLALGSLSAAELRFDDAIRRSEDRIRGLASPEAAAKLSVLDEVIGDVEALTPPTAEWATLKEHVLQDLRSRPEVDPVHLASHGFQLSERTKRKWREIRYRRVLGPHR